MAKKQQSDHDDHDEPVDGCPLCEEEQRYGKAAAEAIRILQRPVPKVTKGQGRLI